MEGEGTKNLPDPQALLEAKTGNNAGFGRRPSAPASFFFSACSYSRLSLVLSWFPSSLPLSCSLCHSVFSLAPPRFRSLIAVMKGE